MEVILRDLNLSNEWKLEPMVSSNLQSTELGFILQHALEEIRRKYLAAHSRNSLIHHQSPLPGVMFLGMDTPQLPLNDIILALHLATEKGICFLCPAQDGGYGMLCLSEWADAEKTFHGIHWSHSLTAVSQLKALTDQHLTVRLGSLMFDVDEPDDVAQLVSRLLPASISTGLHSQLDKEREANEENFVLFKTVESFGDTPSNLAQSRHPECYYTRKALEKLGQISAIKSSSFVANNEVNQTLKHC